jgi:hypothetical protein
MAINFIKLENKNLGKKNYKKIMLQFQHFNNDDKKSNKNWKKYENYY